MWPFTRTEHRQSYTDLVVNSIFAGAQGVSPNAQTIGALETCAGLYARALASAKVSPPIPALTPKVLSTIGSNLIRRGESLWAIRVSRGAIELQEISSFDVQGGADPATWFYKCDFSAPSGSEVRTLSGDSVVHAQWGHVQDRPWQGVGPLEFASASARLAAGLELNLGLEAAASTGHVLPVPQGTPPGDGGSDDPNYELKRDMASLKGRTVFVESVAGGHGDRASAPSQDWVPRRIGASPGPVLATLYESSRLSVLSACGVPPSLAMQGETGPAQIVSFRRFLWSSVQPVAKVLASELSRKLDVDLTLSFQEIGSQDIQARSRSYASLIAANMDEAKAAALTGLVEA